MLKSLSLTNFMGYRSLHLELAPITLLLGHNGSGKSTLLHSLQTLMTEIDTAKRADTLDSFGRVVSRSQSPRLLAASTGSWRELFTRSSDFSADHLSIQGIFDGSTSIRRGWLAAKVLPEDPSAVAVTVEVNEVPGSPSVPPTRQGASAALITHVNQLHPDEKYLTDAEFELAVRSRTPFALVRNRLVRLDRAAIDRMNQVLSRIANATIVSRTALADAQVGSPLAVYFHRGGTTFELGSANHALVSALVLLGEVEAQLAVPSPTGERLVLLDEPEMHFHPRFQADIADHLVKVVLAAGAQLISVTHSDHIARRLLHHKDSAVYAIERPFSRVRRLSSQKELLKALGQTHDLLQFSAINFLAAHRVLFVEGKSDESILQCSALAYFGASSAGLERFEAWTRVPLDGAGNAPAAELIDRLLSSSLLPSLTREQKFVAAVVLDRDYDKEPRRLLQTGPQVDRIEHIWGRHSIESLFIEVDVLESILCLLLRDATPADLSDIIRSAIAAADADLDLQDSATDEMAEHLRRTRQFDGKQNQVEARQRVRMHPEVWQRGKDRAEFVLRNVRDQLPRPLWNKVRSSIAECIEAIPPKELKRIKIPSEITALLDVLVAHAAIALNANPTGLASGRSLPSSSQP